MASVVLELQRDALDRKVPVSDLLRKALVVARKLRLPDFQAWIEHELNGYGDAKVPIYREVSGQVRGWNPYNGWIPLIFEDPKEAERLSKRKTGQSIAQLEHLIQNNEKSSSLHMPFPEHIQRKLSEGFGYETAISLFTGAAAIVGIIDAVRTIILNWALKLEDEGVLGADLSFSAEEKEAAGRSPQNVMNFYGPIQSPQIAQDSPGSIQVSAQLGPNVEALNSFIADLRKN